MTCLEVALVLSETSDFFLLNFSSLLFVVNSFALVPVFLLSLCTFVLLGEGDPLLRFFLWTFPSHSFQVRFLPCVMVCVDGTISGNSLCSVCSAVGIVSLSLSCDRSFCVSTANSSFNFASV